MAGADDDLVALPKAHLHLHLTGAMRPSTLHELAARHQVEVPEHGAGHRYPSWTEFYRAYGAAKRVLHTPGELARLTGEVVGDAAADGALWSEISLSLPGYRDLTGSDAATLSIVTHAAAEAAEAAGIGVGLVIAPDRHRDREQAEDMARLAISWADRGVVGFGLAGDETYPAAPFARAAAIARDGGLQVVPHAGELAGPAAIRATLAALHPDRIMHGVRAVEDPDLLAELAERDITLDVCPTSNVALGVVADLAAHPLPQLLAAGVGCSLNADSTFVFDTSLAREYQHARDTLGLSDEQLHGLARRSLTGSAAPRALVDRALRASSTPRSGPNGAGAPSWTPLPGSTIEPSRWAWCGPGPRRWWRCWRR